MGNEDEITLLTGATGFVGSLVLERLILRGAKVVALVRADSDESAAARLAELATKTWGDPEAVAGVTALAGDVESHRLGLEQGAYDDLAARLGAVVHCAASIRFDLPEPAAQAINVAGTERVVALAERARELGGAARFVHLSTAYVHGRARAGAVVGGADVGEAGAVGREAGPDGAPEFRNTYESTKHRAEAVVARLEDAAIVRPSIIVGESGSGWTSSFNVVYVPLRAVVNGALTVVPADPRAILDIVPVDQVVDVTCGLLDRPEERGVIQVVSGEQAPTIERFANLALAHVGRPPISCDPASASLLGPYAPYTDVFHPFELSRALDFGVRPTPAEELVPRILDHALAANWGRRPLTRPAPLSAAA